MKRILVIGNSHAGALKLGCDLVAKQAARRAEIHFFVSPSPIFSRMAVNGTVFGELSGSSLDERERALLTRLNGATSVDLATFDEILLVGMLWAGTNEILPFLNFYAIDGLYETARPQRLTQTAFCGLLKGAFSTTFSAGAIWSGLRNPRLTLLVRPMPIERVRTLPEDRLDPPNHWSSTKVEVELMRPVLDLQKKLATDFYAERGIDILQQPDETRVASGLTKDKYSRDVAGLAAYPGGKIDVGHMNAEYGRLCMSAYLDRVAPATAPN